MGDTKIDHAVAHLTEPTDTPEQMVAAGNVHLAGIQASPHLPNAPEVSTAAAAWSTDNKALADANQGVIDAENIAAQRRIDRAVIAHRWKGRATTTTGAITVFAGGSSAIVRSFAMATGARVASPLETVPENLRGVRGKVSGVAIAKWKTHDGNHGYMVQTATDPADPATYSAPVHSTKGTFKVPNLTPGSTLHVRVAALDSRQPGGQTAYTAWVAVIVSA